MRLKMVNIGFVILLLAFTGCASKKEVVSFDNVANNNKKGLLIDKSNSSNDNIDKENIQTEVVSLNAIEESITKGNESDFNVDDGLYNTTTSRINGEDITLKSIHFDFDMFALTEENLATSLENSKKINDISLKNSSFKIKLEGNCDEWGNDEYNYALGLKRASAVKNDLVRKGISSDRIVIVSYGESNPICKEQTAQCWTKNRRVDHYLLP